MKILGLLNIFFVLHVGSVFAADTQVENMIKDSTPPYPIQGRHTWFNAEILSAPNFGSQWALRAGAGYQFETLGVDLHFTYGRADYEKLQVDSEPSASTDFASFSDSNSEINRVRNPGDTWTYWLSEVGGSAIGNIFSFLPQLQEKGWVGIGTGKFFDESNGLDFWGMSAGTEVSVFYPLFKGAPWFITGALGYHAALLLSQNKSDGSSQRARLPVHWLTSGLGITFYGF